MKYSVWLKQNLSSSGLAEKDSSLNNWKPSFPLTLIKGEMSTTLSHSLAEGRWLFYMLQAHPNIQSAVINDINPDLTDCYRTIRDNPFVLISILEDIQAQYYSLGMKKAVSFSLWSAGKGIMQKV